MWSFINGPESISWNLYTYYSSEALLSGNNEDFNFGPECFGCTYSNA